MLEGGGESVAEEGGGGVQLTSFTEKLVNADWFGLAVHGDEVELANLYLIFREAEAVFIDDEIGAVDFVNAFEAGGDIHGVPYDGEGFCGIRTDRADDRFAGGEGHADLEAGDVPAQAGDLGKIFLNFGKGGTHIEAGEAGVAGVGFTIGEGAGPERHDGVADEFIHDAMVVADDLGCRREVSVEEVDESIGGELLPDGAETGNIGEEDGNPAAFGGLPEFTGEWIDHVGNNPRIEKVSESFAEFFLGLELFDHLIEGAGEFSDLIA